MEEDSAHGAATEQPSAAPCLEHKEAAKKRAVGDVRADVAARARDGDGTVGLRDRRHGGGSGATATTPRAMKRQS